jgi:murein L,D-transpeptidase YafK
MVIENFAPAGSARPPEGAHAMRAVRRLVAACLSAALLAAAGGWAGAGAEAVVEVDSARREMRVLREGKVLAVFDHVSVGRWGVSEEKRRGDGKTPLGQYRIAWLKPAGQFGPFLGFDYPSLVRAEKGLAAGEISQAEFDAIREAHAEGRVPPQNTRLGGQIGIHGLGRADPRIHRELNWTKGCIALTNAQMSRFMRLVEKGALVNIR